MKNGKIDLFNERTGEIESVIEWSAKLKLKAFHVKDGGHYCLASEVGKYYKNPPVIYDEKSKFDGESNIAEKRGTDLATGGESQEAASNSVLEGAKKPTPKKRGPGRPKSPK